MYPFQCIIDVTLINIDVSYEQTSQDLLLLLTHTLLIILAMILSLIKADYLV